MNETVRLAKFAADAKYDALPHDVREIAKQCTLDFLGAALFGATTDWGRLVANYVSDAGTNAESTVIGRSEKASAPMAALANGTMGHGYEIDDLYIKGLTHPGAVVIPAALAMAEKEAVNGRDFITAIVVGYELVTRAGVALGESSFMRGFHTTGTTGPLGAAAAAGRILALDADRMAHAFGLAASMGAGLMEFSQDPDDTMVKRLHCGRASEGGVSAALLAQRGFTGPRTAMEGKFGYCRALSDKPDMQALTDGLGEDYNIRHTWFKAYPCCGAHHSSIDALLDMAGKHAFKPDEIEGIVIEACRKSAQQNATVDPRSIMSAQYSLPFAAAVALLADPADPGIYASGFHDEPIMALAKKVKVVETAEMTKLSPAKMAAKVTVRTKGNRQYEQTVFDCKGTPENPQSYSDLCSKFGKLAAGVLTDERIDEVVSVVDHLEQLTSVRKLSALVASAH